MADPVSSSRHRASTSSSRHGRTISSTTLLLILSLVLAVLAVLLSLPSRQPAPFVAPPPAASPTELAGGKRAKELATRESEVAHREFEVARREAELLGGSPGGITIPTCSACPAPSTAIVTVTAHVLETSIVQQLPVTATVTSTVTQVQEVVREVESVAIGAGPDQRVEDLHIREHRVSEREKDVGHREELVGRREIDVSRRENWVMEQLVGLEDKGPIIEEEVVYEEPPRRKVKELPLAPTQPPPPPEPVTIVETVTSISTAVSTSIARITVTVPEPASIRVAASPAPADSSRSSRAPAPGRTPLYKPNEPIVEEVVEEVPVQPPPAPPVRTPRVVEVYEDIEEPEEIRTVTVRRPAPTPPRAPQPARSAPRRWFGGGW